MKEDKDKMSIIFSIAIFIVLLISIVYGLVSVFKNKKEPNLNEVLPKQEEDVKTINNNETVKSTNNKNNMENTRVSKNGDTLFMNYTGRLTDGTVFDSNVDPKFGHVEPFSFKLGAGMVIKGWDEGLLGMKVGEKKTLTISPEKGYGARGAGNVIPPNATLIFDVELLDIK